MRHLTIVILIYFVIVMPCRAQNDSHSNHVGVGGLPVFDVLNMFPENQIKGGAININYGAMVSENLSFGVNLFYSGVSNEYKTESIDLHKENQEIRIIGISPNLRYYFRIKEKFIIFGLASVGFGNYNEKTTNLMTSEPVNYGDENESIMILTAGLGLNYFLSEKFALELNVPYVFTNRFSKDQYVEDFHTIAPMIGIQYYW
ncbi:MAG: outer membrane beta-barrel protein [Flavobacteriaceae bacterium]